MGVWFSDAARPGCLDFLVVGFVPGNPCVFGSWVSGVFAVGCKGSRGRCCGWVVGYLVGFGKFLQLGCVSFVLGFMFWVRGESLL